MVPMRVMQVAIDQIVDVVAVRDRFVTASRSVHVARIVSGAPMLGRAPVRIGR